MPAPRAGETEQEYVSRCIPIRRREHPEEPKKQSIRICYEMWRNRGRKRRLQRAKAKHIRRRLG